LQGSLLQLWWRFTFSAGVPVVAGIPAAVMMAFYLFCKHTCCCRDPCCSNDGALPFLLEFLLFLALLLLLTFLSMNFYNAQISSSVFLLYAPNTL
jgi:hypothetical protein